MQWFTRFFGIHRAAPPVAAPRIFLTNTLSGTKELFIAQKPGIVTMYTCGPTVYGPAHIGNILSDLLPDTLARTLVFAGYRIQRVINITDFGHLVTDGDGGEDKMTKGLKREKMALTLENMRILSERYAAAFIDDLDELGIDIKSTTFPRASDFIPEQIALIKTLEQKGYAYRTDEGVYFDTSRLAHYGKLGGIQLSAQQVSIRLGQFIHKRNPADFVLWKPDSALGWHSPWGMGFPGWHIECSAMSRALLGQEIDIHTGGEDLRIVHHNNEIAQSESASGRPFSHYWLHNALMTMSGEKASKSIGNVVYLADVVEKGYSPRALRYLFLQAQYRTPLSFSWESLASAASALDRLTKLAREVAHESLRKETPSEARNRFVIAMRDDLSTPQALGILWDALRSDEYAPEEKWGLLLDAEAHFGLSLLDGPASPTLTTGELPAPVKELLGKREAARAVKDFKEADRLRAEITNSGYRVDDGPDGPVLIKSRM